MGSDDLLRRDSSNSGKKTSFKIFDKTNKDKRGSSSRDYNPMSQTVPRRTRRSLHTIDLNPPDFKVPAGWNLVDDYIEKEVKYIASIPNVPFSIDPTRRNDILRVLDDSRQYVTDWSSANQEAIFSFSAREIKLLRRDTESVIVREVIHNIAAVSYIQDSSKHFVFVKTADGECQTQEPEHCRLLVCVCASKDRAEEICSIIQQIFNIVYTELTLKFFEESLGSLNNPGASTTMSYRRVPSVPSESTLIPPGSREDGHTLKYLLKEYIETIKQKLTEKEVREFGKILGTYKSSNDIKTFCKDLHQLYGEERKMLIPGMRPYIPERDISYFDRFLESHNMQTMFFLPASRRSPSETSTSTIGPGDFGPYSHSEIDDSNDIDRSLLEHVRTVDQLDRSIDS
ncbi:cerebral cavernous malformations protein 2 homolog [Apostichopus japonicus]|uniref:cerebral cavernous malformations protein 2 homolog n=1 Tax=Stichopus japonicus TaxID=307972 RepID=UPI003AB89A7A